MSTVSYLSRSSSSRSSSELNFRSAIVFRKGRRGDKLLGALSILEVRAVTCTVLMVTPQKERP